MSKLFQAARTLSRTNSSETYKATPESTIVVIEMRSFPRDTLPSIREHAFWPGAVEEHHCLICKESNEQAIREAFHQVRNIYSPFSGQMTFGNTVSLSDITERVHEGRPITVTLTSDTESKSDHTLCAEIERARHQQSSPRPTRDRLIDWVVDNHALEGAITRSTDIREALRNPLAVKSAHMASSYRADLVSGVSMVQFMEALDWNANITVDWIKHAHFELNQKDSHPGSIRSSFGSSVHIWALIMAGFRFPDGADLDAGIADLVDEVQTITYGTPDGLVRAHKAQQQFVSLHPFMDGNGRGSRLIWAVLLQRLGYPIAMYPRGSRHILMQGIYQTQINNRWALFYRLSNEALWRSIHDPVVSCYFYDDNPYE